MSNDIRLPDTITVTFSELAKMIDHSLLQPFLTDSEITAGLKLARDYGVATACVKPYSIPEAVEVLKESGVLVCPVIGFPHGNSTTEVKVFEAEKAVEAGGHDIDMVINIGKALSGEWGYVEKEIRAINEAVVVKGGILKVIFENDYLKDEHIVKLCQICTDIGVAFIKTSTGYGYVKLPSGDFNYKGATLPHLQLMRQNTGKHVKIKAAGGVRTLDELIRVRAMGIDRVGASATAAILDEAKKRGIGETPVEVKVPPVPSTVSSGSY